MATDEPRQVGPNAAALRARRHRARRRRGEMVVAVPIAEGLVVGWLLDTGRLAEQSAEDPEALSDAIARVLRELCALR
jgi:hypothetical protein